MSNEDRDDGGLGLDEFLSYDPDAERGGGGSWLKSWKKSGQIDLWLHTESKIRAVWGHQINLDMEVDEKNDHGEKTGRKINKLAWLRFVSPDLGTVNANQYFREGSQLRELYNKDPKNGKLWGGSQATAFMRDPFLILREYLWHAIDKKLIEPNTVVFEWVDYKQQGELIQWTAGEMSRQVKRGFKNRGHSLDTKLEYIFVVVQNDKPGEGPKVARETKLLGDKMRDQIKQQIESKGEGGDPFKAPYCFRWKFNPDAPTPMKMYDAFRIDKNACTPDIWQAIGGAPDPEAGEKWDIVEAPDTSEYAVVNDGDMDKIRVAFEQAAQIELPLDAIFSDDWEVRRSVVTGAILSTSAPRASSVTQVQTRPNPGAAPGAARPGAAPAQQGAARPTQGVARPGAPATATGQTRPAATAPATQTSAQPASASGPQPRRKKKADVEPAPVAPPAEPEPERIPCDGPDGGPPCDAMLLPTDEKCPKCGAEYDIGEQVVAPDPVAAPAKVQPSAPSGAKRPGARTEAEQAEAEAPVKKCLACGSTNLIGASNEDGTTSLKCGNCGCDQGDDIPF